MGREVGRDYVESLWDSPTGGAPVQQGLWGTIGNVWPSTVFNTAGFNYQAEGNDTKQLAYSKIVGSLHQTYCGWPDSST